MTEEPSREPIPAEGVDVDSKIDGGHSISRRIGDVTALVGLIAVLVGSWVSVQGLRDKARADQRTADLTLQDEKIKLQTAHEQSIQHEQDLDLQRQLHEADLRHQKETAASQDAKDKTQRLSDVITRVFTDKESSAGDLSVLFEFLNRDPESKQIIENAVLARLENPRSKDEIDIGFRLMERIGAGAFSFVADANRSARRRYDDLLFQKVAHIAARERESEKAHPDQAMDFPIEVYFYRATAGDSLDPEYDFATLNARTQIGALEVPNPDPLEERKIALDQDLAAAVILRSNLTFRNCLTHQCNLPSGLDLTETYIASDVARTLPAGAVISHAYLSGITSQNSGRVWSNFGDPPDVVVENGTCKPHTISVSDCRFKLSTGSSDNRK